MKQIPYGGPSHTKCPHPGEQGPRMCTLLTTMIDILVVTWCLLININEDY